MTQQTITEQVDEFNTGFTAQIGPELSAVFAGEQADLNAAGVPDGAVRTGDVVPDASVVTGAGTATTLAAVLDGAPAVLVFYRGAWCPYCNIALQTYRRDLLPALQERGVALVAISPQTPEASEQSVANADGGLTAITDPGNVLAEQLGILTAPSAAAQGAHTALGFDVADSNADATRAVPHPTVLIVDAERRVRFADVHVDYTTRTEVDTVLAAVDALLVPAV